MLQCYLYSDFRAKECLKDLPVEPIIWPVVTNTITGIKKRTLFALEAVAVTTEIEVKKYRAQRGRFGR